MTLERLRFLRGCLNGCSEPDSDGQRRYRLLPRLVAPSPTAPAPQKALEPQGLQSRGLGEGAILQFHQIVAAQA